MAIQRTYGPSLALYGQLAGSAAKQTEEENSKNKLFELLLGAKIRREDMSLQERLESARLQQAAEEAKKRQALQERIFEASPQRQNQLRLDRYREIMKAQGR